MNSPAKRRFPRHPGLPTGIVAAAGGIPPRTDGGWLRRMPHSAYPPSPPWRCRPTTANLPIVWRAVRVPHPSSLQPRPQHCHGLRFPHPARRAPPRGKPGAAV